MVETGHEKCLCGCRSIFSCQSATKVIGAYGIISSVILIILILESIQTRDVIDHSCLIIFKSKFCTVLAISDCILNISLSGTLFFGAFKRSKKEVTIWLVFQFLGLIFSTSWMIYFNLTSVATARLVLGICFACVVSRFLVELQKEDKAFRENAVVVSVRIDTQEPIDEPPPPYERFSILSLENQGSFESEDNGLPPYESIMLE